jgi:hypothetical protein
LANLKEGICSTWFGIIGCCQLGESGARRVPGDTSQQSYASNSAKDL